MSIIALCCFLGISRATLYRLWRGPANRAGIARKAHNALTISEKRRVIDILDSPEYVDKAPQTVFAELLELGIYLCSVRTMYRILRENGQVKERRNQRRHPKYRKPELLATGPNQVWSWDITKVRGPMKWSFFYLYVILDIFSRYVVGWMIADKECKFLAKQLFSETCARQNIDPDCLTVHSDRGSSMKSKTLNDFYVDLGITKSFSRPRVSNDNPFSEAQFKTLKYRPGYPDRFASAGSSRVFFEDLLHWYNYEHRHSGLAYLTPAHVHYGLAESIYNLRKEVLIEAYNKNPGRFSRGVPKVQKAPSSVWINPPEDNPKDHEGV